MPSLVFNLAIDAEQYQRLYAGTAHSVTAYSMDGRRVRFPANILRPFVTRLGIRGQFVLHFDDDNRFLSIERLSG